MASLVGAKNFGNFSTVLVELLSNFSSSKELEIIAKNNLSRPIDVSTT